MPTRNEVQKQIQACPHRYIFWTQKEIRALPEILDDGETIKAITSGMMSGSTWLAVCTQRRVIFLNRGMFFGVRQVQFPLDRIQSIDHDFAIVFGSIRVWDGASAFAINLVLRSSILPFVRATEEQMFLMRKAQSSGGGHAQPSDVASQLAKLAELKEKGYLTEEEFQTQKKKLLG